MCQKASCEVGRSLCCFLKIMLVQLTNSVGPGYEDEQESNLVSCSTLIDCISNR